MLVGRLLGIPFGGMAGEGGGVVFFDYGALCQTLRLVQCSSVFSQEFLSAER